MCGAAARPYRPTRPTHEPRRASWPLQSRARGRSNPPGRGGLKCTHLLAADEYAQTRRVLLRLGYIYGEGNPWADAESRGHDHFLESLREQLGVSPLSPVVPAHATALLERVRSAVRNRPPSLDELSVTKKFRGGITGDGPSFCTHLALPVAVAGASFAALTARAALRAVPSAPPAEVRSPGPPGRLGRTPRRPGSSRLRPRRR